ncbi:FkbM family methyltransferase [Neoroseomonas oryzicola]|uniref:FkbM family methyltransferase n=1 Tax=Neoroseomonas oryzicola TaxID=535904 RepID=A0A9X9WH53_9PROT|nr:FkbM family methyltransferase [Neoroseomonas oryzicola]NKE15476.1 FkbM family methyltransferase [Neoroseomonas oryzicola]
MRRDPIGAAARLLRWQAVARRGGTLEPAWVEGPAGAVRLRLRRGLSSATACWYAGLTDPAEMGFVLQALRPGDRMADAGANVGVYAALAAGAAGARVLALEPAAETLPDLRAMLALNGIEDRVEVRAVAAGAAPGTLRFTTGRGTTNRAAADGGTEVPVETLDALTAGAPPLLLKVDVEGGEPEVLAGAAGLLAGDALKAAILETAGPTDAAIEAAMRAAGFAPFAYDPFRRALAPRDAPARPNTLYVRDIAFWTERIATAAAIRVFGRAL